MSLKKLLTDKPGNIKELVEIAKQNCQDIEVNYKLINKKSDGLSLGGVIIYSVGGYSVRKRYRLLKEPVDHFLKEKAKKHLSLMNNLGVKYREIIDFNYTNIVS